MKRFGGRRNTDSYCGERSTETEGECEREDEKQNKVCHALSQRGGTAAPMVPWPSD